MYLAQLHDYDKDVWKLPWKLCSWSYWWVTFYVLLLLFSLLYCEYKAKSKMAFLLKSPNLYQMLGCFLAENWMTQNIGYWTDTSLLVLLLTWLSCSLCSLREDFSRHQDNFWVTSKCRGLYIHSWCGRRTFQNGELNVFISRWIFFFSFLPALTNTHKVLKDRL